MKIKGLDEGIRPAVEILQKYGFKTFESCEGGDGHCYSEPTVRFFGNEFDLFKAYQCCKSEKLNIYCIRRVLDEGIWDQLFNEIVFKVDPISGTIFIH
jgi:hypothetical protein